MQLFYTTPRRVPALKCRYTTGDLMQFHLERSDQMREQMSKVFTEVERTFGSECENLLFFINILPWSHPGVRCSTTDTEITRT